MKYALAFVAGAAAAVAVMSWWAGRVLAETDAAPLTPVPEPRERDKPFVMLDGSVIWPVPSWIDGTGATDVTADLQAFFDRIANGDDPYVRPSDD